MAAHVHGVGWRGFISVFYSYVLLVAALAVSLPPSARAEAGTMSAGGDGYDSGFGAGAAASTRSMGLGISVEDVEPAILEVPAAATQVAVDGRTWVATVGDEFVCATLDWWPATKCNYGTCPWYSTSILNLDLDNPILSAAVKALAPLKLRLGGTLQDAIFYNTDNSMDPCVEPTGNSPGCLSIQRWDAVNQFFIKTGASMAFGLSLYGRSSTGEWNESNAASLIRLTHSQGYPVSAWELGNELLGDSVPAEMYAKNMRKVRAIVNEVYEGNATKPLVIAPDAFYSVGNTLYSKMLKDSGSGTIDVVTRHIYNLGPGVTTTEQLVSNILNTTYSRNEESIYAALQNDLKAFTWAKAWVGESGGASNSGHANVTDSFIMAFWYLDQMGLAAKYNNQAFCRQSLIGGHYGLLDAQTYVPNTDFYGAFLWKTLMGTQVLSVAVNTTNIRAYAHCQRDTQHGGVTILVLNYSNNTTYSIDFSLLGIDATSVKRQLTPQADVGILAAQDLNSTIQPRLEYYMAPQGGDIHSHVALLNDMPLSLTSSSGLPALNPRSVDGSLPLTLGPLTYAFVVLPQASLTACV